MDKLTLADQQKVRKMSDERLRAKLIDAGYEKDDIDLIEREELLAHAEFLVQTQTRVSVSEPPAPAFGDNLPAGGRVSGDPRLEREMFEFDNRKWEAEERRKEAEIEERRAEREERNRKWKAEREDRKAEIKLKEAEFGLKKNEAAKQDGSVGKSKIFSDAMRSSAIRMHER